MNSVVDDLSVGLVLFASVGYALYSLGPKNLRARLLVGISSLLDRLPTFVGLRGIAEYLATAASAKGKGSCGGCDNCGSDPAATTQSSTAQSSVSTPSATQPSATEVRIPLSAIGKRE